MKAVLIGPVCWDVNISPKGTTQGIGGVPFYLGYALTSILGPRDESRIDYLVSCGSNDKELIDQLGEHVYLVEAEGTITCENESSGENLEERIQRINVPEGNIIFNRDLRVYDFSEADYIIVGPLFHDNIPTSTFFALSRYDVPIVLLGQGMIREKKGEQVVHFTPDTYGFLENIDYLILDSEELKMMAGRQDELSAVNGLRRNGVKNIIVTKGPGGSDLYFQEGWHHIPAFSPEELECTVGAGDTYAAGLLFALNLGYDPLRAGYIAAMTATMKIERKGPFIGTFNDVLFRLAKEGIDLPNLYDT
ncbi:hypothetical protein JXC34_04515 [Candidatus Woesearchaeota archaeon]|nr:hypothetical protein [Candidatus Woesearchaeota archaeon]